MTNTPKLLAGPTLVERMTPFDTADIADMTPADPIAPAPAPAFSLPSVLVNRFHIMANKQTVRISFADADNAGTEVHRSSVCMSYDDFVALRDTITDVLNRMKAAET